MFVHNSERQMEVFPRHRLHPIEGPLKNVNPPYPKIVLLLNQTEKKERKKENALLLNQPVRRVGGGVSRKVLKRKKQSWGCWRKKADSAITERYFFVSDLKVYARLIHLNVMFLNERVSSLKTATFNAQLCLLIMNREENCFKFLMKEMHEAGNEQKNWIFKSPKWNNPILFFIPGKCRQDFTAEIWYFCFFSFRFRWPLILHTLLRAWLATPEPWLTWKVLRRITWTDSHLECHTDLTHFSHNHFIMEEAVSRLFYWIDEWIILLNL